MPLYVLVASVEEMENIAKITAPHNHQWIIDFKNPTGDDVKAGCYFSATDVVETENAGDSVNFVVRMPGARSQGSATVVVSKAVSAIEVTEEGQRTKNVPIAAFDCRGLEPIRCEIGTGFIVTSTSGTVFTEDVDLSEEWSDYDEKSNESVSITGLTTEFRILKETKKGKFSWD
eukprot:m.86111 g.86111  ORF g.86111 m.86111 type:complete len:174 (-) comp25928_c0_seq1:110-631(-)